MLLSDQLSAASLPACLVDVPPRRQTKESVEGGIQYLLQQRKKDPYGEFLPRQLYEAMYQGRQAPTFPLNRP